MKLVYRVGADAIFVFHFLLVLFVVFGWLTPKLWPWYMAALVVTLISDLIFGYCILSKWEFDLRKKHNPDTDYNFAWATYYTYKITNHRISDHFYRRVAITALVLCIGINLYFKFWFS